MAFSAMVTKKSVVYVQPKLHSITFNLVVKDGETEVLNKDFPCQFHSGDSPAAKVAQMISLMQVEIDNYKSAQTIFTAALLDTAVTKIQNGLSL